MGAESLNETPGLNGGNSTSESDDALLLKSLPPGVAAALQALVNSTGKTVPVLLQDAVLLEKWVDELKRSGDKLFVQGRDGALHEVTVK